MSSRETSSKRSRRLNHAWLCLVLVAPAVTVLAQDAPPDPSQPYLQPPPLSTQVEASGSLSASPPAPEAPAPAAEPAPAPEPAAASAAPPPAAEPAASSPPPAAAYTPPPPPPAQPPPRPIPDEEPQGGSGFSMPPFAIGFEPLDMILEGRFAPQIEVGLWNFISVELVPLFFISSAPPLWDIYGINGRGAGLYRDSNGIGPLSGASLGAGIWLGGKPFRGLVLRPFITNYGTKYTSKTDGVVLDTVTFTERRLGLLFGSMNRFGPLALSFGIGLSYELNPSQRCELYDAGPRYEARSHNCGGRMLIHTNSGDADLFGPLHPFAIEGRLAIAIVVD